MSKLEVVGSIVRGRHGHIMIRQKSDALIELGDLLIADEEEGYTILQVYDLAYGSQISARSLELISGMKVEGLAADLSFMDPHLRNYVIVEVKAIASIRPQDDRKIRVPKTLPQFLREVRHVTKDDLFFLEKPENPIYLGSIRSGSKILDVEAFLDGVQVLTHHVLVPATTGRGKSNLVKVMAWSILGNRNLSVLILDPHDEYYGRHGKGLKDHPEARECLRYYSPRSVAGSLRPVFHIHSLWPRHFRGIIQFSDAQHQALNVAANTYGKRWLEALLRGEELKGVQDVTLEVLKRKIYATIGVYIDEESDEIRCRTGTFSDTRGESTLADILNGLEDGLKIILDTSLFSDAVELLVGSIILNGALNRYKRYKREGSLDEKPVLNVVIEEAPRVLGSEAMASGSNIYSDIAREGRKFKIGLTAITQLTSIIPRTVLANMNTKVILGNELKPERDAIINSAAQDLSQDDQAIASLDVGEAIISSNFTKFAVPIHIPLFEDYIRSVAESKRPKIGFVGGS